MRVEEYLKSKEIDEHKSYFVGLIKNCLFTTAFVLVVLIMCNVSPKFKKGVQKYLFETNYNFAKINSFYQKYILNIKKETKELTSLVSKNSVLDYKDKEEIEDGVILTVEKDYPLKMLESGLVVFVGKKDGIDSIIVQQSNGIDVIYKGVSADVKVYDYIEKGSIIGKVDDGKLYLSFQKDGKVLDYEPYIEY